MKLFILLIFIFVNLLISLKLPKENFSIEPITNESLNGLSLSELEKMLKKYDDKLASFNHTNSNSSSGFNIKDNPSNIFFNNKLSLSNLRLSPLQQSRILSSLVQPNTFLKLPPIAMNLLANNYKSQQKGISSQDSSMSSPFIDSFHLNGRKGQLTLIDTSSTEYSNVWVIVNSKVIAFYSENNYLKLIKLFRLSQIEVKDFIMSPCFFITHKENNNKVMLCALDYKEKSYWVSILKYYTH